MSIPFASERNLILFVHFAFVFENDDEEECIPFCMSYPERIPCSGGVSCSKCCLPLGGLLITVGFGSSEQLLSRGFSFHHDGGEGGH
jgi:hypothetical protein